MSSHLKLWFPTREVSGLISSALLSHLYPTPHMKVKQLHNKYQMRWHLPFCACTRAAASHGASLKKHCVRKQPWEHFSELLPSTWVSRGHSWKMRSKGGWCTAGLQRAGRRAYPVRSTQPAGRGGSRIPRSSEETLLLWPWDKARQQFSEKCLLQGEIGWEGGATDPSHCLLLFNSSCLLEQGASCICHKGTTLPQRNS